jgi:hypothetical protein
VPKHRFRWVLDNICGRQNILYAFSGSIRPLVLLLEYPGKNGRVVQRQAGEGKPVWTGFFVCSLAEIFRDLRSEI